MPDNTQLETDEALCASLLSPTPSAGPQSLRAYMRRRINEVARFTKQPRAVAEFYAGVLGQPLPEAGRDVYNFDVAGVSLFIHPIADRSPAPGWPDDVDHIALEVEDLDAECERLAAAGYAVKGPTQFPWGRSAYLYDPDGRMVELHGPDVAYGVDE